jgi:hypothetical protein
MEHALHEVHKSAVRCGWQETAALLTIASTNRNLWRPSYTSYTRTTHSHESLATRAPGCILRCGCQTIVSQHWYTRLRATVDHTLRLNRIAASDILTLSLHTELARAESCKAHQSSLGTIIDAIHELCKLGVPTAIQR